MERAGAIAGSAARAVFYTLIFYIISLILMGMVVMYVDMPKPLTFVCIVVPGVFLLTPFIISNGISQEANRYMWQLQWFEKARSCDEKTLAWIHRIQTMPREEWKGLDFSERSVGLDIEGHALITRMPPSLPEELQFEEFERALHETKIKILAEMGNEAPPEIPDTLVRWEKYVMRQAAA